MQRSTLAVLVALALGATAACGNAGLPAFENTRPKPLAPVGPARDSRTVRIEMKSLPWWTVAGTSEAFILGFDDTDASPRTGGTRLGAVRSRNIDLSSELYDAVRCAWQVVPMGDSRPCSRTSRTEAMAIARDAITEARAERRAHAGDAGAGAVVEVRCFAQRERVPRDDAPGAAHLWCEGIALDPGERVAASGARVPDRAVTTNRGRTDSAPADPTPAAATDASPADNAPADLDPAAPIDHEPRVPETRLVLLADASIGMLGTRPIVGSTLALRYRPFEIGFYILDLQRESLAPREDGLVGIGITALGRIAIGRSRADAIIGISSVAAAVNNTTNPTFEGLYHGFAGIAYQTPWRIAGAAQPFVQLRAGAAAGGVVNAISGAGSSGTGTGGTGTSGGFGATIAGTRVVPMLELHVGLSSPERR